MSHSYAGNSASYPANITIPDDGDPAVAASVGTPLEQLADRCASLDARLDAYDADTLDARVTALETTTSEALKYSVAAGSLPAFVNDSTHWTITSAGIWRSGGSATTRTLALHLPLTQVGKKLSEVRIRVGQNSGSGLPTSLPSTKPTLKVYKSTFDGGSGGGITIAQVGTTTTDPAVDLAAYRTARAITVTPASPDLIAAGAVYWIEIESSNGDSVDNSDEFCISTVEYDLVNP